MPAPGDSASKIKADRSRIYGRSDLSEKEKAQEYAIYSEALRRKRRGKKGAAHTEGAGNLSRLTVVPLFRGRPRKDSANRALRASVYLRLLSIRNRLRRLALTAASRAAWDESKHPRGQPGNPGQFAEKEGGGDDSPEKPGPEHAPDPEWNRARNERFNDLFKSDHRVDADEFNPESYAGLSRRQLRLDMDSPDRMNAGRQAARLVRNAWNAAPEHLRQHVGELAMLPLKAAGSGFYRFGNRLVAMGIGDFPEGADEDIQRAVANTLVHELGHAIWFEPDYMTDDERVAFGRAVFEAGGPLTNYADSYSTQRLVKIHEALSDGTIPVRSKKAETALQKKHSDGKWAVSMRDQGRRRLLEPLKILGIRNAGPEHYNDNELLNLIERKVGTGGVYSLWRAADDWAADPPDSAVGEEAEAVMRGEIAGAQPSVDRIKLVSMDGESLRRKFIRSVIDHYAHLVREYGPTAEKYERFLEREKKRQEAAPRKRLTARQREKLDDEIAKLTLSRRNKGADRYVSEAWAEATALYWGPRNDEHAGKIQGYNWEVWRRMRPAYEKIMTRLRQDGYRAKGDSRPSLAPVVSTGWQPATKPLKASGKELEPASDAEFADLLQDLRSLASQKTIRTGRSSWSVYLPEAVVQVPDAANEAEAEAEAERIAYDRS